MNKRELKELEKMVSNMIDTNVSYTERELNIFRNKFTDMILEKYHREDMFGIKECMSAQEILADDTISIRSMINSCLIYGKTYDFINENTNQLIEYGERYCAQYANNDKEYVVGLYYAQKKRFATAKVIHNVFTDDEGVNYNSVEW